LQQQARARIAEEQSLLEQALQRDTIARTLELAQEVKNALLVHEDLGRRQARMTWRLQRWQLFENRRLLYVVRTRLHFFHQGTGRPILLEDISLLSAASGSGDVTCKQDYLAVFCHVVGSRGLQWLWEHVPRSVPLQTWQSQQLQSFG
jgi:hypothetical protein